VDVHSQSDAAVRNKFQRISNILKIRACWPLVDGFAAVWLVFMQGIARDV